MTSFSINNQSLKIFTSPYIEENMYLLVKGDKALVIDPNGSEKALQLLKDQKVQDVTIFLTHEHPDHSAGIPLLLENFKTKLICQADCAKAVADKNNNRPLIIELILRFQDEKNGTHTSELYPYPEEKYECHADITFEQDFNYNYGDQMKRTLITV